MTAQRRAAGTRLARARSQLGLTQQQLADAIGSSLQTVKSYEGGRRTPTGRYAAALARIGVNLAYIFEDQRGPPILKGEARDAHADLVAASALRDTAAKQRVEQRTDRLIDRFRAAQHSVDEAAKRCSFIMPQRVRDALLLAVMEGMKPSALESVMQLLREDAPRRLSKSRQRRGSG